MAHAESSRLGSIGNSLRSSEPAPRSEPRSRRQYHSSGWDDDDSESFGDVFFSLFFRGMLLPFQLMRESSTPVYARYPYDGFELEPSLPQPAWEEWPWNGSAELFLGRTDDELDWWGMEASVASPLGIGFDTELLFFREEVDSQNDDVSARLQEFSSSGVNTSPPA